MLGGFCFSVGTGYTLAAILASAALGFLIATFVFKNILCGRKAFVRLCVIMLILSLLLGMLFNFTAYPTKLYNSSVSLEGTVTYANHSNTSYSTVVIRTDKINGDRDSHRLLFTDSKEVLSGLNVGDKIIANATVMPLLDNGAKSYYLSLGYSALGENLNGISITEQGGKTFSSFFAELRDGVHKRLCNLTDKRTGDFLAALLTGERVVIDPALALSFSRTGTTHILALSGAHLVILAYAVSLVLKLFKMGKGIRTVFTALAVIFYVPFTGLSASVTRAGVMVLISSFIFLIARRSDGPTTLALSVFFIILAEPYAVYDIALWLSALATMGLLLLSQLLNKRGKRGRLHQRAGKALLGATLASVFAISASMIISLFFFDGISVLALPATLVLSFLTEFLMYLSIAALLVGGVLPVGRLVLFVSELTFDVIGWFSRFEYSLIPLDFWLVKALCIILTLLFFCFVIFSAKKHRKISVAVLTAVFVLLNAVGIIQSAAVKNRSCAIYYSDESCNILTVSSDGEYSVIASGMNKLDVNKVKAAADSERVTVIDNLVLASYTYYTINSVTETLSQIYVERLVLPAPITTEEYGYALYIAEYVADFDTVLDFFNDGDTLSLGEARLTVHSHSQPGSSRLYNSFSVADNGMSIFYLSADCVTEDYLPAPDALHSADTVIVGGAKYAKYKTLSVMPSSAKAVIFGANYGLLEECREFLNEKGVSVKFTDTPIKIN